MLKRCFSNKTFKTSLLLMGFVLWFLSVHPLFACKIDLKTAGEEKKLYQIGDIIDLNLTVAFTHRACPTAINETEFNADGLEIFEATEWKETRPRSVYEKTLKLKVTSNKEGKLTLAIVRKCDREGGFGSITFKAEPLK